jgi:hypothetical protein
MCVSLCKVRRSERAWKYRSRLPTLPTNLHQTDYVMSQRELWKGHDSQWLTKHKATQTMRQNVAVQYGHANHDPRWPTGQNDQETEGEGVGPTAKGQQKRTGYEQFF